MTEEKHKRGAVGLALQIQEKGQNEKIGLMVAGNSGRPGGGVGRGLDDIPTVNHKEIGRGIRGKLDTQEESVVASWMYGECGNDGECRDALFRSTICGRWGQTERQGATMINGVDYTDADESSYAEAWVVRDAKLVESLENTTKVEATLVFVAGPNAGFSFSDSSGGYGSTKSTVNIKAKDDYGVFEASVKASVRAGLLAMQQEGVQHALVARVSCGIYAGTHKEEINKEYLKLVQEIVNEGSFAFRRVTVVGK